MSKILDKCIVKVQKQLFQDEDFLPYLTIKDTLAMYDKVSDCKSIKELNLIIDKYKKKNTKQAKSEQKYVTETSI